MSWFKKNEYMPGSVTLSVCLDETDTDYKAVIKEFSAKDFRRVVIVVGTFADLNVLAPCATRLEVLMLQGSVHTSFVGMEKLTRLVDLNCDVSSQKPLPDYSKLENLEKCFLAWDKKYDAKGYQHGLFTLPKLRDLTLRYWTKPDCTEIAQLKQLEKLDLRQGALASLDSLEKCSGLVALELSYLPKLTDIRCLAHLQSLQKIHIQNCPNISDYAPLTKLENLRHIHLEKMNAHFEDLSWLTKMRRLDKICLSCEISKIDWKHLFNHPTLKYVAMSSHEGYSVSDSEILKVAETSSRKVRNFKRIGTKKKPSFVFDLE